jgi:abhydrolase domain-containing protein 11
MSSLVNLPRICAIAHPSRFQYVAYSPIRKIVNLAYNEYNVNGNVTQKPPVVIMHGLFGSKFNWNSLAKAMNAKTEPPRKVGPVN